MTLEFWDSCDKHYKEIETDEIEVDGKTIIQIKNEVYNQALEDAEKRYREWSKSEYGKVVADDVLPLRVLRSLKK